MMLNPSDTKQPETILIIDDTPDNLRFLSDLLERAGYAVRKVISGDLGLEAAQLEPPDLILLDIKMPGLDGYQVCDRLKSNERTRSIPVIFLSAMSEELDKVMAFEAGCVDYITKPFQVVEVLARIENQLQVSRLRKALEQRNQELQRTIAQRTSAEIALETLNQDLETRVQARIAYLQTALDQAQHSVTLTPDAVQALQIDLETLVTAAEQLEADLQASQSTLQPYLQTILQTLVSSARSIQQILAPTLPDPTAPLQSADLSPFCQSLLADWPLSDRSHHQLAFASWGRPSGELPLDAGALKQLLTPILANALHYSPQGGTVLLQIFYKSTEVRIEIRDEGIGIPPIELDRICEQFYRASNAKGFSGKGLGLFNAQQIVRPNGGSLSFSSQLGEGTTVTLTLPLRPAA